MIIKQELTDIILINGKELKVDKFVEYAGDNKFFAIVKNDLYINRPTGYSLLKQNYTQEVK